MLDMRTVTTSYWYWMSRIGATWAESISKVFELTLKSMDPVSQIMMLPSKSTRARSQFRRADARPKDFFSTVNHELRTPLTSIRAVSTILQDNPDMSAAQREQFLDVIVEESERLTCLVDEVLDLAELELGNVEWQLTEVDLKETIEGSLLAVSKLIDRNNIQLWARLPDRVPPVIADQDRIMQVILSLLSNAIKFCDGSAGWVGVRLQVFDDVLQVEISDNGPGIGYSDRHRISDKVSYKIEDIIGKEPQTTSLGLLISRHIISHFNGELWSESELNHGAKFCFTLPLASAGSSVSSVKARSLESSDIGW